MAKYGVARNGWDIQRPSSHQSGMSRGTLSIKEPFDPNITYMVGSGGEDCFWLDMWVGDRPLAARLRYLFRCAVSCRELVSSYTSMEGGRIA